MARVAAAVAAVRHAVRVDLAALGPRPDDLVLVACSGGADSLALAAALAHEAGRVGRSVRSRGFTVRAGAVVVDHGLQPGSDDVAARAAAQCRALGLDPVVVRRVSVGRAGGLEAAARTARYAALDEVAADAGAVAVLLGHTLDDQAEQVLLSLARGSGARALGAIGAVRGVLRRPLLGLRRAQTQAACQALGLAWWDDPTNAPGSGADGATPLRTRVRHEVLPVLEDVLGPGVAQSLARSADLLRADADALDALAADLLDRARVHDEAGGAPAPAAARDPAPEGEYGPAALVLDVAVLAAAPDAVRRRALRAAAIAVGAPAGATGARHVAALDALVVAWRGQRATALPSGASARRACGRLFLHPGRDTS
ncbi:tRNA lysidine(34) synthetase TilS [Xylanimonas ulmi]|uniref:tRNA(Ile)-lysidine synthase n=1 Tax=Xylanimonas ulmi TaxID=228973 RepID=A0A4Q7M2M0_9MICO|nr:tRNA lysidine(34) synthetase TilS [Xylanibacterium ulmi]RZS62136.1 tRNA(Ile)-lysidine synthase [Xylanibacterium ulmi]